MIFEMADEGRKQDEANKMQINYLVSIFLSNLPFQNIFIKMVTILISHQRQVFP